MKRNMPLAIGNPPSRSEARCKLTVPHGPADPLDLAWEAPRRHPLLEERDVHVWTTSLDAAAGRLEEAASILSVDERARAGRFHFDRDRRRFIVGRAMLRALLGSYLEMDPASLTFEYGPAGKPTLGLGTAGPDLKFNVAHSGALALYAVTWHCEVGIDIERLRMIPEVEKIAGHYFSPGENAQLRSLPWARRSEAFLIGWTRKEAYLKARGIGLSALEEIEVSLLPNELELRSRVEGDPLATGSWSLCDLHPGSGYVAALVTGGKDIHVSCWTTATLISLARQRAASK
jgi:4'-phosphopantetheinyl transferase